MAGRSVIVSAVRTPFGKLGGGLAKHEATELGAQLNDDMPKLAATSIRDRQPFAQRNVWMGDTLVRELLVQSATTSGAG